MDVALSNHFLGWIFSLGTKVKIVGPAEVVERGQYGQYRSKIRIDTRIFNFLMICFVWVHIHGIIIKYYCIMLRHVAVQQ